MLEMNCPICKEVIKSPFLADVSSLECVQCNNKVQVKDLYITSKDFVMHREDFLNRIFRFQKLLREVEKERISMENDKSVSEKSFKSIDNFYCSLKELLEGARSSYRMDLTCDLRGQMNYRNEIFNGKILNLSTDGVSIEFSEGENFPRSKSEIRVSIALPGLSENISIGAKVVWVQENIRRDGDNLVILGIVFTNIDEHAHSYIWNYILDNAPVPFQRTLK